MTVLLAFDTTTHHCAAALLWGDRLVTLVEPMAKGQAERLVPLLEELLAEAGLTWADLDGIGVGTGPGNFTGIRIGVAAARGLALGLDRPAIGVTAFEAAGHGLPRPVTITLPAPRGQIWSQHLTATGAMPPLLIHSDAPGPSADPAANHLVNLTVGPKAGSKAGPKAGPAVGPTVGPNTDPAADAATDPDPARMIAAIARIAAGRLGAPQPRPAPCYVRGADAAPPRDPAPVLLP